MRRFFSLAAALLFFAFAAPALSRAQSVPTTMTFQGRLAKPDGTPVADVANQSLTFRLYSAASGGTLLWSQSGTLPVRNGTFAARFDFSTGYQNSNTLSSVFNGSPIYLEVQIGNGTPLTLRQLLTSNAYAFTALNALSVAVGSIGLNALASGVLNFANLSGQISAGQIAAGSITGDKLANGTITGDKIAGRTIGLGNLAASLQQTLGFLGTGGSAPAMIGSVSTDSNPRSVAVSGNTAYVVNYGNNSLQVFDVSNAAAPTLKGSVETSVGPVSVAVSGNTAYVVNAGSNSLQVFDVSNPASPTLKGSATTGLGSNPRSVAVSGNMVCVVNYNTYSLQVFDVSNAAAPTLKGSVETSVGPVSVAVSGNTAYVVNYGSRTLQVFDVSNPAAPTLKGSATTGAGSYPISVAVSGNMVCVVNFGSDSLQVFDVSNPAAPTLKGSVETSVGPVSVAVSGNTVYVVNYNGNTLQTFDVSNAAAPTLKGSATTGLGSNPYSVAVSGNMVCVVNSGSNTLQVFQPSGVTVTGSLTSTGDVVTSNSLVADSNARNNGALSPGLLFGGLYSGEGIASKRTAGGNQYGLDFYTTNASRMSITQSGNVGIGTTSPASKLDVNGTANVSGALSAASAALSGNVSVGGNVGVGTTASNFPLSFSNTLGDKISLYGQSSNYYGFGVQGYLLQIHGDFSTSDIVFGYGSSAALTETMRIKGNGNVGIGTATPGYKLDVNGAARVTSLTQSSDARYKSNIVTFPNALDAILGLRGVTFDWNRDLWQDKGFASGRQVGFIAQEVESVLPELVTTDANGYKSVAYQNVVPVLVEAVKTLKKDNDAKNAEIASVKADNAAIKSENAAKNAEITAIKADNAAMKARLDAIEKLLRARKP